MGECSGRGPLTALERVATTALFIGLACSTGDPKAPPAERQTWECSPESVTALHRALPGPPFATEEPILSTIGPRAKIVARRQYQPSQLLPGYREILTITLDVGPQTRVRPTITVLLSKQALGDRSDYRGADPRELTTYETALRELAEEVGCKTDRGA